MQDFRQATAFGYDCFYLHGKWYFWWEAALSFQSFQAYANSRR